MSDEGERTCPLCAEEMDLTDRQLKPCKCGYEICVWCWHHIMDMAEKDDTEGRCPACRSPYDKDKIVGMAANCERVVAEISSEKKMKSQRAKTKSSEGRKQLSSVRVIQRNLVYIVGLPLNLADEELLQRREYFGQYGKVLKVSMSRTAAGVIQQFPNSTCSVYITYLKEEEAVRCIQSVHGFVLDGRTLKACFGTTKYCHAWLRNVPCTNPDCLYLHEVGSQEDSFTKDEIISAYTRSRVQQITGATNNMQRRSGNVLPPPIDDLSHESAASAAKPIVKNGPITAVAGITKSPPNGSSCRSLPAGASWGMRASSHPQQTSLPCSNGPSKQKNDTLCGMSAFSSVVKSTNHASTLHNDVVKKSFEESQTVHAKGRPDQLRPLKQDVGLNSQMPMRLDSLDGDSTGASVGGRLACASAAKYFEKGNEVVSDGSSSSLHLARDPCFAGEREGDVKKIQGLCSNLPLLSTSNEESFEKSGVVSESSPIPHYGMIKSLGTESYAEQSKQLLNSAGDERSTSLNSVSVRTEGFDLRTGQEVDAAVNSSSEIEEDVLSFDNQRTKDPEVNRLPYVPNSASSPYLSNHPRACSPLHGDGFGSVNLNSNNFLGGSTFAGGVHGLDVPMMSGGHPTKLIRNGSLDFTRNEEREKQMRLLGIESNPTADIGESSIISNMLSMDFDTWDESLTSPQNLAKLLGDTEQQPVSLKLPSWKAQNNNQSRFSFARQEENHSYELDRSFGFSGQVPKNNLLFQDDADNRDVLLDKLGLHNGYSSSNFEGFDKFNSSPISSSKPPVSRNQVSVPPGFSVPSRAPPPGFSSHSRGDQFFGNLHGNHLLDPSPLLRNSYQSPSSASIGSPGDLEFMDPAILAVGKGRLQGGLNGSGIDLRSNEAPQLNAFENEARLHLLMQRSLSPHQNLRYGDGDSFASRNDSYGITSKMIDQPQVNISQFAQLSLQQSRSSHLPSGQWDGWNDVQGGNGLGMAELLRNNERLGFNKFYNGYEESKFRMPNSGDLYSRTFGV